MGAHRHSSLFPAKMEGTTRGAPGMNLLILFFSSFFLNAYSVRQPAVLGWSQRAAAEAEAVAAIYCSGHGRTYLDSPVDVDGRLVCECNHCYTGIDCSHLVPDCPADADSGDPTFLEAYWRRHQASGAVLVSGWHRMSYLTTGRNLISLELERHIRRLHNAVGNAVTNNRFIIFGTGSTQLLNAAVLALSTDTNTSSSSSPASVVASVPYYPLYKSQANFFHFKEYEWKGITSNWLNQSRSSGRDFIEFVTSPNNPDGRLHQSVIGGSAAIHDHAYYWPHYSAIPAPADEDVMLFSGSKLSGHASSRFGWALVKDEKVYKKMVQYLLLNSMGVSRDTQLRILQIIKAILKEIGGERDIFEFGYKTQSERWSKLNRVISLSDSLSLQELSPQYCNYFKRVRNPSPAFGWLKCEEDKDCITVLSDAGIIGRTGTFFEADGRYARLSLIKTNDDFDQLLRRLEDLMILKKGVSSI